MMIVVSSILAVVMASLSWLSESSHLKNRLRPKKLYCLRFLSTGALMFLFPMFHVTGAEFLEALTVGMIFSIFLIKTSKFEIRDDKIYIKRSKSFVFILIALLVIRIAMKSILSTTIDYGALSGMFWILAFGMIVPWRIAMFLSFRKLSSQIEASNHIQVN